MIVINLFLKRQQEDTTLTRTITREPNFVCKLELEISEVFFKEKTFKPIFEG